MGIAVPFPDVQSPGNEWFVDEPVSDARRNLQLEVPPGVRVGKTRFEHCGD